MRVPLLLSLLFCMATPLMGDQTTRRYAPQYDESTRSDTVRAATANAVRNLYDEVGRQQLKPDLSVRKYLRSMEMENEFIRTLQGAEQVGDPRWVDSMCQVQLEIPATRVGYTLRQFADSRQKNSLITSQEIERAVRSWPQSVFGATGSAAGRGADIRPRAGSRWNAVSPEVRQRALDDAAQDAAHRVMESVKEIPLGNKKTVGDAFADPKIGNPVHNWLISRPMSRVDFRDNLDVEVGLAADAHEFFDMFRVAAMGQNEPITKNPDDWRDIEKDFVAKMAPAVGRAHAREGKAVAATNVVRVGPQPPAWINKSIDIVGTSGPVGGKLKTARAAERDAQMKLTERIELLELNNNLTLGQAARQDPRIAAAISRTVERVTPHKIQYNSDGSVTVNCEADLRDLWEELRR
jgi:hypothetical protein